MFKQRAFIVLTMGPLGLALIYFGGWWLFIPLLAIATLAVHEYENMVRHIGYTSPTWLVAPAVGLQFIVAQLTDNIAYLGTSLFVGLFAAMCYALWRYERQKLDGTSGDWLAMTGAIIFFGWLGSHFIRLRTMPDLMGAEAWQWTLVTLFAVWSADSFAYLTGAFVAGRGPFGRHALSPRLSPKKSVEGYFGGIILSTLLTSAVGVGLLNLPLMPVAVLTIAIAVTTTAGDLAISMLKRESGIKDSGTLFPGHGGALDRIDTVIWAVAMAYYLLYIIAGTQ